MPKALICAFAVAAVVALPALAAAGGWAGVPAPAPGNQSHSVLSAVSCLSASSCMAVGTADDGIADETGEPENVGAFSERWDGSAWTLVPTGEAAGSGAALYAISCVSPEFCIAVGQTHSTGRTNLARHSAYGAQRALVETWNGSAWTVQADPGAGIPHSGLFGVSCVSADFCVAVGGHSAPRTSSPLVEVWNGTGWKLATTPTVAKHGSQLSAVSCAAADACTAVGWYNANPRPGAAENEALAERWNGRRWSAQYPPSRMYYFAELNGVSCPTRSFCLASGVYRLGSGDLTGSPVAESWNDSGWAVATAGLPKHSPLYGVSCLSETQCSSVGQFDPAANPSANATAPLVEGWNGSRWARAATPDAPAPPITGLGALPDPNAPTLFGISCLAEAGCTAVGGQGAGADDTTLVQAGPNPPAGPPRPPAPVFGRNANIRATAGSVLVKLPGAGGFVPLAAATRVPLGTVVDASDGTVKLTTARGPQGRARTSTRAGATQSGLFHGGAFRLAQRVSHSPFATGRVGVTVLDLAGRLPDCGRASGPSARGKHGGRRLWGDAHGNYETGGRYGSAAVGGTKWLTEDTCAGTRVKVARGIVAVTDSRTHRTVLVKAGHSFLARP